MRGGLVDRKLLHDWPSASRVLTGRIYFAPQKRRTLGETFVLLWLMTLMMGGRVVEAVLHIYPPRVTIRVHLTRRTLGKAFVLQRLTILIIKRRAVLHI